jgi:hypothetical protein
MSSLALNLSDLAIGMPGLTPAKGLSLAEAAAVCLESNDHESGVPTTMTGDQLTACAMHWQAVTQQQRDTYADMQEATEDGAAGVAILVANQAMGLSVMERSYKGTGFDYWMGDATQHDEDDELPFHNLTRLEVSGILQGDAARIARRVRVKLDQVEPTDHIGPAIIVVVEFGGPVIHMEAK